MVGVELAEQAVKELFEDNKFEYSVEEAEVGKVYSVSILLEIRGYSVSILHKSIAGRYQPVRVAVGPITTRYRFM